MPLSLYLTAAILLFAPLVRSGKTAMALMCIEIIGILLLITIFWSKRTFNIDKLVKIFILFSLCIPVIYLIPLSEQWWLNLPGRGLQTEIVTWIESTSELVAYKALSLYPLHTLSAFLLGLSAIAVFLSASSSSKRELIILALVLLGSATLQGVIAFAQYITSDPFFYFGLSRTEVLGTYLNTNHLTALMEMVEPLALALMVHAIIESNKSALPRVLVIFTHASISLLLTFIAFTTTSRMGTFLLILSIFLSFWAVTTPEMRKQVAVPIFLLRLALLIAILVSQYSVITTITGTVAEMEPSVVLGDLRWGIFQASWEGIQALFPFGSGPGAFPQTIQVYLPADNPAFQNHFMNHAHNDYLELIYETGVLGVILLVYFFYLYLRQWLLLRRSPVTKVKSLQSASGIGMLIILIFSLTDFNLHTPANLIVFAFICGIFFRNTGHKLNDI